MITNGRNISDDFFSDGIDKNYNEIFSLICKNIDITISNNTFIYFIDENYVMDTSKGGRWENLTPDYSKILNYGLEQLKYPKEEQTNDFCYSYNLVIENLIFLAKRIIEKLKLEYKDREKSINFFSNMITSPAQSFEESLQRMLFVNQIFWQTDHRLMGLGAWDSLLISYYENDIKKHIISKNHALELIQDVYKVLHENYRFKSNVLMGDTGQIFVLGKTDKKGNYIFNDLTELFIAAMRNLQLPEPKCLLRVNKNTPRKLLSLSLESISTGIGAPLLANDDIVVKSLIDFGIPIEDALNWTTSACWEPLIFGKSSSMNNMAVLNFLQALKNVFLREDLLHIQTFEELFEKYINQLKNNVNVIRKITSAYRHQYNPLLSVFIDDCKRNKKDVSQGGAKYHNIGFTTVAMGNLIDSLLYIKEYVFDKKQLSLLDVKRLLVNNFSEDKDFLINLRKKKSYYGSDNDSVIKLVNNITECVANEISDWRTYLGGKFKFGLSGSAYLDAGLFFSSSFDGRNVGDPFTPHISNEDADSYTELVNFSSNLEYSKRRFNGNVLDFMVNPDFIRKNWDKFLDLLELSIKVGFFEMQMNVVSSKILIEAKNDPSKFPNLIVRVWGFSSYFKDLPENYKDMIIERTIRNEQKVS